MKKAVIIYHTRTGTTKKYAEEIAGYLSSKNMDVAISSTIAFQPGILEDADYILLGCWTSGLFVIGQHPEKLWQNFAAKLPELPEVKLAFFTTYKLLTGSMFRKMYSHLKGKLPKNSLELKSRDGLLSSEDRNALDQFTA